MFKQIEASTEFLQQCKKEAEERVKNCKNFPEIVARAHKTVEYCNAELANRS